jgi:hypothetical protein
VGPEGKPVPLNAHLCRVVFHIAFKLLLQE